MFGLVLCLLKLYFGLELLFLFVVSLFLLEYFLHLLLFQFCTSLTNFQLLLVNLLLYLYFPH